MSALGAVGAPPPLCRDSRELFVKEILLLLLALSISRLNLHAHWYRFPCRINFFALGLWFVKAGLFPPWTLAVSGWTKTADWLVLAVRILMEGLLICPAVLEGLKLSGDLWYLHGDED